MILGKTDHYFSFPVEDLLEIFGVTLDNKLIFSGNIWPQFKKIKNQFSVKTRFGKLISTKTLLLSYKVFILPHFYYCSMVWHFCSKRDSDKLDLLNKRILQFIFEDWNSDHWSLLKRVRTSSLANKCIQNVILTVLDVFILIWKISGVPEGNV